MEALARESWAGAGAPGKPAAAALLCATACGSRSHGLRLPSQSVGSRPVRSSVMAFLRPLPLFQPCVRPLILLPASPSKHLRSVAKGGGRCSGRGSPWGRDSSPAEASHCELKRRQGWEPESRSAVGPAAGTRGDLDIQHFFSPMGTSLLSIEREF